MSTDWTTDSNEALHLSLVRSTKDKDVLAEGETFEDFHPTFTYPIYGEDEKIYGYRDLVIDLRFASGSLTQYLDVRHSARLTASASSTVDDVRGTLEKYITSEYCKSEAEFLGRVEEDADSFKPFGEKIYSYTRPSQASESKGKGAATTPLPEDDENAIVYEVYHAKWDAPGFKEYHRRMQVFILLYVEGGSYIDEDEELWEFAVLFEKRKRRDANRTETYHFIGYSSLYPFFCFPNKVRLRLSQFVIIPPFQHQGHGQELYTAIYQYVLSQPNVSELTVEDPAEAFEDLRDRVDMRMLLSHTQFIQEAFGDSSTISGGGGKVGGVRPGGRMAKRAAKSKAKMGPPSDKVWLEKWRVQLKLAARQYHRLVEMLLLLHMDTTDALAIKAYRLQVKERLYRFNYDALAQLEDQERLEKLEETFQSVKQDYQRILSTV